MSTPLVSGAKPILEQIEDQIQLIQAKVQDTGGQGVTLAAHLATLLANVAISDAVADTLTTNVATSKTVIDLINDAGNAGTGLGPIASMPTSQDLETWLNAAIVAET